MVLSFVLLLVGFAVLIKGADFLVAGSSSVAKKFNISNIAIGLTVVSFGTSAPEMVVSVISSINDSNDAAFGNIVGSNNFNLLFILGVAGLIYPLVVKTNTIKFEVPLSIAAGLLVFVLVNDELLWGKSESILSRFDALLLLALFMVFMYYIYRTMKSGNMDDEAPIKIYSMPIAVGMAILGMAMLLGGGSLAVDRAVTIATYYGVSERLIGLTVLAIGTSLPELATSAVAAFRKNTDIAIGNVVGSNIFNFLFILGVNGTISPIPFNKAINFDLIVCGVATVLLLVFMFTINQRKLDRWEAAILFVGYLTYTSYLIFNDIP